MKKLRVLSLLLILVTFFSLLQCKDLNLNNGEGYTGTTRNDSKGGNSECLNPDREDCHVDGGDTETEEGTYPPGGESPIEKDFYCEVQEPAIGELISKAQSPEKLALTFKNFQIKGGEYVLNLDITLYYINKTGEIEYWASQQINNEEYRFNASFDTEGNMLITVRNKAKIQLEAQIYCYGSDF